MKISSKRMLRNLREWANRKKSHIAPKPLINLESLEPRLLLSVTAMNDVYNVQEDELFRTGTTTQVINATDNWFYHDNIDRETETYPIDAEGNPWNSPVFAINDGTSNNFGLWDNGPGPFAEGIINAFLELDFNPTNLQSTSSNQTTILYRSETFEAENPQAITQIQLNYLFDDGGIVYLNGEEILRVNTSEIPITTDAFADSTGNEDFITTITITLPDNIVKESGNVIAVETHNTNISSSDAGMYLDVTLIENSGQGVLSNDDLSNRNGNLAIGDGAGSQELFVRDNITLQQVGVVQMQDNGDFTYTPTLNNYNGTASFEYVLADSDNSSTGIVTLNVQPVNDPPTGNPDQYYADEGEIFRANASGTSTLIRTGDTWDFIDQVNNGGDGNPVDNYPEDLVNAVHFVEVGYDPSTSDPSVGSWTIGQPSPFEAGTINAFDGLPTTPLDGIDDALDGSNSVTTYLFRKVLDLPNGSSISDIQFDYLVDDGAVIYINGQEVFRTENMVGVPLGTDYFATGTENEDNYRTTPILDVSGLMNNGENVVAIEVHQTNATSSDAGMDLRMYDATLIPGVLENDPPDIDGDAVTAQLVTDTDLLNLQNFADLTFNPDGTFILEPTGTFAGTIQFNYAISDGTVLSDPIPVTINVSAVDDGPVVAEDDFYTTNEDNQLIVDDTTSVGPLGYGLLLNDTTNANDINDPVEIIVTNTNNLNGNISVNNDNGTFIYTPNADFFGTASFTYVVNDGFSNSNEATVYIEVVNIDDAPIVVEDVYDVQEDQLLVVNAPPFNSDTLIDFGSEWYYLDNGSDQGTAWYGRNFNPATEGWSSGVAELGYGDGDESTVVGFGPDDANKFPTTYFQRTFNYDAAAPVLQLTTVIDDGAAVYINGVEVFRQFLDPGATFADFATGGVDQGTTTITLNPAQLSLDLQPTGNTIAVEVHQVNATSSDMSFDLMLATDTSGQQNPLSNDVDPDGDAIVNAQLLPGGGPTNGQITFNPDGTFIYLPNENFFGTEFIYYTIEANGLRSTPARMEIIVDPAPDPFAAESDLYQTGLNESLNVQFSQLEDTFDNITQSINLIPEGAVWKYLDDGSDQGTAWRDPDFIDTPWLEGVAEFGYGDGDESTIVSFGADPFNKHITTYFRKQFDLPPEILDSSDVNKLILYLKRDDGAAVYINNIEVARDNLLPDAAANQMASTQFAGPDEETFFAYILDLDELGITLNHSDNLIAVEIHNVTPPSSDLSFDLRMDIVIEEPTLGVLKNDHNPDNLDLSAILVDAPLNHDDTNGAFVLNADGTFNYTPVPGFVGVDYFTYMSRSSIGAFSEPTTVAIIIGPHPFEPADINQDQRIDALDIDQLALNIKQADGQNDRGDLNGDGEIDESDFDLLVESPIYLRTLKGDYNLDGRVDMKDLATLATNFGQSKNSWSDGNTNGDSVVNLLDLAELASNYGRSTNGGAFNISNPQALALRADMINASHNSENLTILPDYDHIQNILED